MWKNRLCYLIILLCTAAFFICFNGYYSLYTFALSLAMPMLSLLVSLPGMLTLRLDVDALGDDGEVRVEKQSPAALRLTARTRSVLPSGRAWATLVVENAFIGEEKRERLDFTPGFRPVSLDHHVSSANCGVVDCRLERAWVCDLMGLVALPVRPRSGCQAVVLPNIYSPLLGLEPEPAAEGEGERYSQQDPGSDPSELFQLREYRPGDRLSRIDWKLSQKAGGLLVRQGSLPISDRVLFLLDLSGDGQEADACMDVLATLGDFLAAWEAFHTVAFWNGGSLELLPVAEPMEARMAVEAVMRRAERSALPGEAFSGLPAGAAHIVYICPSPDSAALGELRRKYPLSRLTVLHTRPLEGLPDGAAPVRIRPGNISQDLDGLLL